MYCVILTFLSSHCRENLSGFPPAGTHGRTGLVQTLWEAAPASFSLCPLPSNPALKGHHDTSPFPDPPPLDCLQSLAHKVPSAKHAWNALPPFGGWQTLLFLRASGSAQMWPPVKPFQVPSVGARDLSLQQSQPFLTPAYSQASYSKVLLLRWNVGSHKGLRGSDLNSGRHSPVTICLAYRKQ